MFLVCLSVCVVYWLVGCLFSCLFFGCLVVLVVVNVVVVVLVLALLPVSVPRYLVVSCPAIPIGHYFLARCGEPCVGQGGDPSKNFGAKKALRLFSGSLAAGRVGAIPSLNLMTWWLGPGFSERLQQMTGFGRGIGINLYKDYIRGVWKSLDEWMVRSNVFELLENHGSWVICEHHIRYLSLNVFTKHGVLSVTLLYAFSRSLDMQCSIHWQTAEKRGKTFVSSSLLCKCPW